MVLKKKKERKGNSKWQKHCYIQFLRELNPHSPVSHQIPSACWLCGLLIFLLLLLALWRSSPTFKDNSRGSRRRSRICRLDQNSSTFKRNNRLSPPLPFFLSVCVFLNPTFSHRDTQSARRKRFIFFFFFCSLSTAAYATSLWRAEDFSHCFFFFSIAQRNVQFKEFIGSTFLPVWGKLNTLTCFVFFAVTVSCMSVEEE